MSTTIEAYLDESSPDIRNTGWDKAIRETGVSFTRYLNGTKLEVNIGEMAEGSYGIWFGLVSIHQDNRTLSYDHMKLLSRSAREQVAKAAHKKLGDDILGIEWPELTMIHDVDLFCMVAQKEWQDHIAGKDKEVVIPWMTAVEIAEATPDTPDFLVDGYLYSGALHELDAKIKMGKTSLAYYMVGCMLQGKPFLGHETKKTAVVYLSEERLPTIKEELMRLGLTVFPDLHILPRHEVQGIDWKDMEAVIEEKAREVGAGLIIVDTLSKWASLVEENESSADRDAMTPMENLAAKGFGMLVLRQNRKGGGELSDAARGHSAMSGTSDVILGLRKLDSHKNNPNLRYLEAEGRFNNIIPQIITEWCPEDKEFKSRGTDADVKIQQMKEKIMEIITDEPMATPEFKEAMGEKEYIRATFERAIKALIDEGLVQTDGEKKYGDNNKAYGYWKV